MDEEDPLVIMVVQVVVHRIKVPLEMVIHLLLVLLKEIMVVLHLVVIGTDLVVVVELQRLG